MVRFGGGPTLEEEEGNDVDEDEDDGDEIGVAHNKHARYTGVLRYVQREQAQDASIAAHERERELV